MKTKILLMGICATMLFACKDDKEKAYDKDDEYFKQDSIASLQIKGYEVNLISGQEQKGNYKTDVKYLSLQDLVAQDKEMTKDWGKSEKEAAALSMRSIKHLSKGGMIMVILDRPTREAASVNGLTIVLKDNNDKEIHQAVLKAEEAEYNSLDHWYNVGNVSIEKEIKAPFFVYVKDNLGTSYKFEVKPIKK
jgi:hypothetical protein